jgi:hypothetical protein
MEMQAPWIFNAETLFRRLLSVQPSFGDTAHDTCDLSSSRPERPIQAPFSIPLPDPCPPQVNHHHSPRSQDFISLSLNRAEAKLWPPLHSPDSELSNGWLADHQHSNIPSPASVCQLKS